MTIFQKAAAAVAVTLSLPVAAMAQTIDPLQVAIESGVCGDLGVLSASFTDTNTITAICNEDAEAFLPLVGGLAPVAAALGGIIIVAAAGGGDGPSSTTN